MAMKLSPYRPSRKLGTGLLALVLLTFALAVGGCGDRNPRNRPLTSLSEQDRVMLQQYEAIRVALAQDDFRTSKRAAAGFQKGLETTNPSDPKPPSLDFLTKIANATALETQREVFRAWSNFTIDLTKNVEGFYVIHCPLPSCGDWLQTDAKVNNPYMGKAMQDCGEVKK